MRHKLTLAMSIVVGLLGIYVVIVALLWAFQGKLTFPAPRAALPDPQKTLGYGEKIELRGFGSFRVRERGARRGRNPKTGDPVSIPAKRVPYFKPGKELKELINDDNAESHASAAPAINDEPRQPPIL